MSFSLYLIATVLLLLCILLLGYIVLVCCPCICNSFMKRHRRNAGVHTEDNEYTLMNYGESGNSDDPSLIVDSLDHVGINVESLQGSYFVIPPQQLDTISTINLTESKGYGSSSVSQTQVSTESMEKQSLQEQFPKLKVMMQEEITDDVIYDEADDEHTRTKEGKMLKRPGIIPLNANNMLFSQKQAFRKVSFEIRNAISSACDSTCSDQGQQMNTDSCEERPYDLPDGITVYEIPPETDASSPGAPHFSNQRREYFQQFLASTTQTQVSTESMEKQSSQDQFLKLKDMMQEEMTDDVIYDEADDEHTRTEEGKMPTRPGIIPFNANMLFCQKQALRKVSCEIRNSISSADDSTCSAQKQQQNFDSCEERPYDLPDGITVFKIPSDTDHNSTGVPHMSNQRREYAQQFLTCSVNTPVKEESSSIPTTSTVNFDSSYSMPRELVSQDMINGYVNTLNHNDGEGKAQELVINTAVPESSMEQERIYDEIPDSNNQIRSDSAECHLRDDADMQMHLDKPLSDETAPIQLFQNMLLSQKKALRKVSLETREPITVSHESEGSNQKLINSSINYENSYCLLDERLPTVGNSTSWETPYSLKDMQGNVQDLLDCGIRTSFRQNAYLTAVASEEKMGNSCTMLEDLPEEATVVSYYENILLSKKKALKKVGLPTRDQ